MPIILTNFIIRQPRVPSVNDPNTLAPSSSGTWSLKNALTIQYTGSDDALMTVTATAITTIVNEDLSNPDNLNVVLIGQTLAQVIASIQEQSANYTVSLLGTPTDLAFLIGQNNVDVQTHEITIQYGNTHEYLIVADNTAKLGHGTEVSWIRDDFSFNQQGFLWSLNPDVTGYTVTNYPVPSSGIIPIENGAFIHFTPNPNSPFDMASIKTETNEVWVASAGTNTQFVNVSTLAYLSGPLVVTINESPGILNLDYDLNGTTVSFLRQVTDEIQTATSQGQAYIQTEVLGINGIISSTAAIEGSAISDPVTFTTGVNDSFDFILNGNTLAVTFASGTTSLSGVVSQINSQTVSGTASIYSNLGQTSLLLTASGELIVLSGNANTTLGFTTGASSPIGVFKQAGGVGPFVPLIPDIDFFVSSSTQYQGAEVSDGKIFFTQTLVDESLAQYIMVPENELFSQDLSIYQNGALLDPSTYIVVYSGGFLNLNTALFPGDTLTASYYSQTLGPVVDEILAGSAATIFNTLAGPFNIDAGNDTLNVTVNNGDGPVLNTFFLPLGSAVPLSDIVTSIASQTTGIVASLTSGGNQLILSSIAPGTTASIEVNSSGPAFAVLGFTPDTPSFGSGAIGGDFAFTLAGAPVVVNSFSAPQGGNVILIDTLDLTANYPPNALIQVNSAIYLVDHSVAPGQAALYSAQSVIPVQISLGVNDQFIFTTNSASAPYDLVTYTITLTSGALQIDDLVNDINTYVSGIAFNVNFNGVDTLQLISPVSGIASRMIIGTGTANQALGFVNNQTANYLQTYIYIQGAFSNQYTNPTLSSTRKTVSFFTIDTPPVQQPQGVNKISFSGVNLTEHFHANTVVKINLSLYVVLGSQFLQNNTVVTFTSALVNPIYVTDVVEVTESPIYVAGDVTLFFPNPPIQDLPITVKDNGITLQPNVDYTLNPNNTITLAEGLTDSSVITSTFTIFDPLNLGDVVKLNYGFFSNLNQGSLVTGTYQYFSPDQFFFDVVYQHSIAQTIQQALETAAAQGLNPSSSGFPAPSSGGSIDNSTSGNASPTLAVDQYQYNDDVAKILYDFFDNRINAFTNERYQYTGVVVGGTGNGMYVGHGVITESDIQATANPPCRLFPAPANGSSTAGSLFPTGYNSLPPYRVPALDGLGQNDDGTTNGGSTTPPLMNALADQLTQLDAEPANITGMLSIINISSPVFLYGADVVSPVLIYSSGINQNDIFLLTVDATPYTVTFVGSPSGVSTTLASIISQINAVINCATIDGAKIQLEGMNGVIIGSGNANTSIGFTTGQQEINREGSIYYTNWFAEVNSEIFDQNTQLASLNLILGYLTVLTQDYLPPYSTTYTEAIIYKATVAAYIPVITADIATNTSSLASGWVNINSNLTGRATAVATMTASVNAFLSVVNARISQITSSLASENLFNIRYAWLDYRTNRGTGTIPTIQRTLTSQGQDEAEAKNQQLAATSF